MTLHPVPPQEKLDAIFAQGYRDFVNAEDDSPYDDYSQPFESRAWRDGYEKANASDDAWDERERNRLAADPDADYWPDLVEEDEV